MRKGMMKSRHIHMLKQLSQAVTQCVRIHLSIATNRVHAELAHVLARLEEIRLS